MSSPDIFPSKYLNPTFSSEFMKISLLQDQVDRNPRKKILIKQAPIKDQLDIATRQYTLRKGSLADNPQPRISKEYTPVIVNKPSEAQLQRAYQPTNLQSSIARNRANSQRSLKLRLNNDESVYLKQMKPYNIISNVPQIIHDLRTNPKYSYQYKHLYMK